MKASLFLAAIVPALCGHALDPRATACKNSGNNCQRGVVGTNGKPALSVRLADCSSYLSVTVTPAETTTTVTATSYSYVSTITIHTGTTDTDTTITVDKRTAATEAASLYPAYATYCDNASAYYSACSCAGITPATTTAPTPTVTYTATTQTVITCAVEYAFRKRGWQGMGDFVDYAFH